MLHDFELLEWIGANSFRTSHYPYSEDVLDYADRQGIVVIDETAGGRAEHGPRWRDLRRPGLHHVLARRPINDATREVHAQAIRELVARDKNHPSVVLWSIANEPESDTEGAEDYFRPLFELARELDPTRPGRLRQRHARPVRQVPGLAVRRRADAQPLLRLVRQHRRAAAPPRSAWEAGAARLGERGQADHHHRVRRGHLSRPALGAADRRGPRSTRSTYLDMNHRVFDRIDAVVGEQVWNFADFATTSGIMRVGGNKKGAFTRDRQPKAAAFALRRRWRKEV